MLHAASDVAFCRWELRPIKLSPFGIGKYPVTNLEFMAFVWETKYDACDDNFVAHWRKKGREKGRAGWICPAEAVSAHPVVYVSHDDASAYCAWAGARLPTYEELQYAARGNTGWRFPWGNEFSIVKAVTRESPLRRTVPVDAYSPQGDSIFGVTGLCGNAWAWTDSVFEKSDRDSEFDLFLAFGSAFDHMSFQQEIPLNRSYRNHSVGMRVCYDRPENAAATGEKLHAFIANMPKLR